MNTINTARAFDRAMKGRAEEAHAFVAMDVKGMESVCGKCYTHRDKAKHTNEEASA